MIGAGAIRNGRPDIGSVWFVCDRSYKAKKRSVRCLDQRLNRGRSAGSSDRRKREDVAAINAGNVTKNFFLSLKDPPRVVFIGPAQLDLEMIAFLTEALQPPELKEFSLRPIGA
jgi:hypothetical protein